MNIEARACVAVREYICVSLEMFSLEYRDRRFDYFTLRNIVKFLFTIKINITRKTFLCDYYKVKYITRIYMKSDLIGLIAQLEETVK